MLGFDSAADTARIQFLRSHGYVPKETPELPPTAMLDWLLEFHYAPAYWREPVGEIERREVLRQQMMNHGNGLVFVQYGDRARIDMMMAEKK